MDRVAEVPVFGRLAAVGDPTRARLLRVLERGEFTVGELTRVLALPQSTVSRHLKVLAREGWITSRADGTSRHYRMATGLEPGERAVWEVVREGLAGLAAVAEDADRAAQVRAERRARSRAFFSTAAEAWDHLRAELFGADSELLPLLGLLDPSWTVGDLGTGTGHFAARIAPFVRGVVAVDGSAEMLEAARARLAGAQNVELREGELEALPVGAGELDVAVLMLVLPYVSEPARVVAEACRTLAPGGRLVVVDLGPHAREEYRETLGHLRLGVEQDDIVGWMTDAGLEGVRWHRLPARIDASGPRLFLASGRAGHVSGPPGLAL